MIRRLLFSALAVFAFTGSLVAPSPKTYGPAVDTGVIYIAPTGSVAGDTAAFEGTGITTTQHVSVYMKAGIWNICKQETLAPAVTLTGAISSGNPGSFAPNMAQFQTLIQCPSGQGTWSSGQAFINVQDSDVIQGIAIFGNAGTGDTTQPLVDAFGVHNALYPKILDSAAVRAFGWGVNNFSDGAVPGFSIAVSQGLILSNTLVYGSNQGGYNANWTNGGVNGGGFVSDQTIGPNNDFAVNGFSNSSYPAVQLYIRGPFPTSAIFNNRIEDGEGNGIVLDAVSDFQITGNNFDKEGMNFVNGGSGITLSGNRTGAPLFAPSTAPITFNFGSFTDIQGADNDWTSGGGVCAYTVTAGTTIVNSTLAAGAGCDAYSISQVAPLQLGYNLDRAPFIPLTLSGSTFSAPDLSKGKNFLIALPNSCTPCTVSTPSTIPLPVNQHGFFAIIQSPTGGASLSWGPLYNGWTIPATSTIAEAITYVPYVVTQTGVSLGPQVPVQNSAGSNVLTGGPGMTSGWGGGNATFANAVGGCVDPIGGSACSTITEDSTFNRHQISQNTSLAGLATFSEFINAGTPHTSGVVTASFTGAGNSMNVTGVTSGAVVKGALVNCSCAVNGAYVVGFNSGSGGTGTYFLNFSGNVSSTSVTLTDPRFLAMVVEDAGFANSAAIAIDPTTGNLVDPTGGFISSVGKVTGTGVIYGAYAINVPGTTWYYMSLTYGGFTAGWQFNELGLLGQNGSFDWTDYQGDGGGFVQVYGPTLVSGTSSPTGKWTFPGAVNMPNITSGTPANGLCQDSGHNLITCTTAAGTTITDGTHTVTGATSIQFNGTTVSGTTPNGVVTVSGATPSEAFIATQTATLGVTTELDFTALTTAYTSLHFVCRNIIVSASPSSLFVQAGEGGGPTWETAASYNTQAIFASGLTSSTTGQGTGSTTGTDLVDDFLDGISATAPAYFDLVLTQPNLSGVVKPAYSKVGGLFSGQTTGFVANTTAWWGADTNTITGIRLKDNTGTFGGTCSEYGQN